MNNQGTTWHLGDVDSVENLKRRESDLNHNSDFLNPESEGWTPKKTKRESKTKQDVQLSQLKSESKVHQQEQESSLLDTRTLLLNMRIDSGLEIRSLDIIPQMIPELKDKIVKKPHEIHLIAIPSNCLTTAYMKLDSRIQLRNPPKRIHFGSIIAEVGKTGKKGFDVEKIAKGNPNWLCFEQQANHERGSPNETMKTTVDKLDQEKVGLMRTVNRLEPKKAGLMKENETLRDKLKNCEEKIALLSTKSGNPTTTEIITEIIFRRKVASRK